MRIAINQINLLKFQIFAFLWLGLGLEFGLGLELEETPKTHIEKCINPVLSP